MSDVIDLAHVRRARGLAPPIPTPRFRVGDKVRHLTWGWEGFVQHVRAHTDRHGTFYAYGCSTGVGATMVAREWDLESAF